MNWSNLSKILLFSILFFFGISCTESEEQQQFEREALMPPSGITVMDANGMPVEDGENDPDDWRTAPDFSGLIEIQTAASPNPVSFNQEFDIVIDIKVLDAVEDIFVSAFRQPNDLIGFKTINSPQPGLETIRISPGEFASSSGTGTIGNVYRIIFYNGQREVITYGDVLVE